MPLFSVPKQNKLSNNCIATKWYHCQSSHRAKFFPKVSDIEQNISTAVSQSKSEKTPSPIDETANFNEEWITADWVESAQETWFTRRKISKVYFLRENCKLEAHFKPSHNIVWQKWSARGAEKFIHQTWEDQSFSVEHIKRLIYLKELQEAGKYVDSYFEKDLPV